MGETWVPQLATIDRMSRGRLAINIISSDMPGETLESAARYRRTREWMRALRTLLDGRPLDADGDTDGEFVNLAIEPPQVRTVDGSCPLFYFGGFSDDAKDVAAAEADVFLTWPDTVAAVAATVDEMRERAGSFGRSLRFGLRAHVIVRDSEADARHAADRLVSRLDDGVGARIRSRSLDAGSAGVQRQAALRDASGDDGFVEEALWTGIGRARSGAGAAIVGDPAQVLTKIHAYQRAGINAFVLSGYPHLTECDLFAHHVLPHLDHAPLT